MGFPIGSSDGVSSHHISFMLLMAVSFGTFVYHYVGLIGPVLAALGFQAYTYYHNDRVKNKKTPLSPWTLIQLANGAYSDLDRPLPVLGWSRMKRHYSEQEGPCIDVFYHSRNDVLVLAVRGTDPSLVGDLTQDVQLFQERVKAFVQGNDRHALPGYALELLKVMSYWEGLYPHCQLYLTGHSLGAACCEAAWLADLALKSRPADKTTAESSTKNSNDYRVWRCVTWESPGFAVNAELREVLNQHRDTLDTHVVHYLGAPNVINCLHPHLSINRRYRILLEHDNRLTAWHLLGCIYQDIIVISNWVCAVRGLLKLGAYFSLEAAQAAEIAVAAASKSPPFSVKPAKFLVFCEHHWRKLFVTPTCPDAGSKWRVAASVLTEYNEKIGDAQVMLFGWFQNVMPIGDSLNWQIVCSNALMQGEKAVEYLCCQHSLLNHINSFDVRSGYPLRWVQMDSWPCMSEMISRTAWEGARNMFIPRTPSEHVNPGHMIENRIHRLNGYSERRRFSADHQVLRDTYDYLGVGFFDEIIAGGFLVKMPLNEMEWKCRQEYRRCNRTLPAPVYIVG